MEPECPAVPLDQVCRRHQTQHLQCRTYLRYGTLALTFTPNAVAKNSAIVTINNNGTTNARLKLDGTGILGTLITTQKSLSFGNAPALNSSARSLTNSTRAVIALNQPVISEK